MAEFILKEFLLSNMTLKAFARTKKFHPTTIKHKIYGDANYIAKSINMPLIDYMNIDNQFTIHSIKKDREKWLSAIDNMNANDNKIDLSFCIGNYSLQEAKNIVVQINKIIEIHERKQFIANTD